MSRHLLIAEDDRVVAYLLEQVLVEAGYSVLVAQDGLEAIDHLNAGADRFAMAVLDLVMPRADGAAVLAVIATVCPGLPVVLSSGYPEAYVRSRIGDAPIVAFLPKPWRPEALLDVVGRVLGPGRPT
ncbi:MAG: response regulator [Burkholderiales bacterium]|nr:MAG: response regulator [Burkholderiales bacterium]